MSLNLTEKQKDAPGIGDSKLSRINSKRPFPFQKNILFWPRIQLCQVAQGSKCAMDPRVPWIQLCLIPHD